MLSDVLNDVLLDILDYTQKYSFYSSYMQDIRNAVDPIIHLKGLLDAAPDEKPYQKAEQALLDWNIVLFQTISNLLYLAPTMMHDGRPEIAEYSLRLAARLFETYYNPRAEDERIGDDAEPRQHAERSGETADADSDEIEDADEDAEDEDGPEPADAQQVIQEGQADSTEERADGENASEGHGRQPGIAEDESQQHRPGDNDNAADPSIDDDKEYHHTI